MVEKQQSHEPDAATPAPTPAPEKISTPATAVTATAGGAAQPVDMPAPSARITKLKSAFLYVLIGALVISAIVAVMALLIGQFNASIGRSFLTIFILFAHSLFILGLLWADTRNQVGRNLLPTTILALTFANMLTTMLATWDIISIDTAWRTFWLYFLILGTVYIISGSLKLRIAHTATQVTLYTAVGLISLAVLSLVPWVLDIFSPFDPIYFRIIAALSILATTAYMIAIIMRGLAIGRNQAIKATRPVGPKTPSGLLAIYITLGVFASIVWLVGIVALTADGLESTNPIPSRSYDRYDTYEDPYYN